jgi:hypothetical protein
MSPGYRKSTARIDIHVLWSVGMGEIANFISLVEIPDCDKARTTGAEGPCPTGIDTEGCEVIAVRVDASFNPGADRARDLFDLVLEKHQAVFLRYQQAVSVSRSERQTPHVSFQITLESRFARCDRTFGDHGARRPKKAIVTWAKHGPHLCGSVDL